MGYSRPRYYSMNIVVPNWAAPGDTETKYCGQCTNGWTVTPAISKLFIPRSGIIREVTIAVLSVTAVGSAEAWPLYIRLNNTTDHAIETITTTDTIRKWHNSDLNCPVSAGDYIELKTVNPTWAVNPQGCFTWGTVLIETA